MLTAVWALAAIPVWYVATRQLRSLPWFAAAFVGSCAVAFGFVQLLSHGRFLDSMLATAASTDVGTPSILTAPLRGGRMLTERALGVSHLFPLAALGALAGLAVVRRRPLSIYLLAWFASAGTFLAALAHPGAQWNHLVDPALLTVIAAAHITSIPVHEFRRAVAALLPIAVLWATLTSGWTYLVGPAVDAVHAFRTSESEYIDEDLGRLGRYISSSDVILSEDPGISVLLGHDPVILEPYVFRSLAPGHPEWMRDVTSRLRAREFDAVVLVRDPDSADGRRFYRDLNLGIELIDAVVADYELSAVVGEYHVYRPRATG